ncbi:hypothetical protein BJX99DRAFT_257239 [Aspergillus californicus]
MTSTEPSKRANLLDLPNELLLDILAYLDKQSLVSLACVPDLSPLVLKALYSSVAIHNNGAGSFGRAFSRDPTLAEHCRSLTIHYKLYKDSHYGSGQYQKKGSIPRDLVPSYCSDELSSEAHDCRFIPGSSSTAPGANSCPNRQESVKFQNLLLQSLDSNILDNLETCELNFSDRTEGSWDPSLCSAIFLLPRLKSLSIIGAVMHSFNPPPTIAQGSTSLETLTMIDCAIRFYRDASWSDYNERFTNADADAYVDAIAQQSKSLTSLDVDLAFDGVIPPAVIPDFRRLEFVEYLTIRPMTSHARLQPAPAPLPSTLKRLVFLEPYYELPRAFYPQQQELVDHWANSDTLPKLTSGVYLCEVR